MKFPLAAGAALAAAALISTVNGGDSVARTTYTFSVNATAAKDSVLVVGIAARDTLAISAPTVTWNGNAPAQNAFQPAGTSTLTGMGLYTFPVAAGSNITANLLVTFSRAPNRCIYFAAVVQCASPAWRDQQFSVADPGSVSVAALTNGLALGYAIGGQSATTFTWNVGTKDFDNLGASALNHSGMHFATPGGATTITATRSIAPSGSSGIMGAMAFR